MSFPLTLSLALLISLSAFSAKVEMKPLNQNQLKFRRLPPREFSAAIGSSITIECEAGGSPQPTIHWLKNGVRIPQDEADENQLEVGQLAQEDEVNQIGLSSTRSRLFIDCAHYADEATYSCVAENSYSRISSQTKLNLIRPIELQPQSQPDNELLPGLPMELDGLESSAEGQKLAMGSSLASGADQKPQLAAVPQCLSQRGLPQQQAPLRIHMWTHNIVEVMKNSVLLYCRSSSNKKPLNVKTTASESVFIDDNSNDNNNNNKHLDDPLLVSANKINTNTNNNNMNKNNDRRPTVSWTLPNDELLTTSGPNGKYEIMETGDLLIRDLRWSDMGSYMCTVSNDSSSDSVSAFVYPASVKASNANQKRNQKRLVLVAIDTHRDQQQQQQNERLSIQQDSGKGSSSMIQ